MDFKQLVVGYPNAMFLESRQRWYSTGFQDTPAISVKRRAACQGKVQRNSKKVGGQGEEVL